MTDQGHFSNTVEVEVRCGVCETQLKTRVASSAERTLVIRDFHDVHRTCRISRAADEATR